MKKDAQLVEQNSLQITVMDSIPYPVALWVLRNVTEPIAGFQSKRNFDGTYFTIEQQIQASQEQMLLIALDYNKKGYPLERILHTLSYFVNNRI